MFFQSPGEVAFNICSLEIRWYGIIMSLSILFGICLILAIRNKYFKDITVDSIFDFSFFLIIWGLISARAYYVILDYRYFIKFPFEIPAIWNGGLSIQGAVIGGIIAALFYTKKHKISFFKYSDLYSFCIIAGQIIGRWGNFFNSEAFGFPTDLPWKLFIPFKSRPIEFRNEEFFHPAFLYESLLNIIVLVILYLILIKLKNRKDGIIFSSYLILYSIVRIFVESIRVDSVLNISNVHIAHIVSYLFIFVGIVLLFIIRKSKAD